MSSCGAARAAARPSRCPARAPRAPRSCRATSSSRCGRSRTPAASAATAVEKTIATWDVTPDAAPLPRDILYCVRMPTLLGGAALQLLAHGSLLAPLFANAGAGGCLEHVIAGEGLPASDAFAGGGCGALRVRVPFPPWPLSAVRLSASPLPLLLLPCATSVLPAQAAGGVLAASLRHSALCADVEASEAASGQPPSLSPVAICLFASSDGPSPAAAAACAACVACTPTTRWRFIRLALTPDASCSGAVEARLCEDERLALSLAPVIVIDLCCDSEPARRASTAALREAGIRELLWLRHAIGAQLLAVGDAAALLGPCPGGDRHAVLPLPVRGGGGQQGWSGLRSALLCAGPGEPDCGAGCLLGSLVAVDAHRLWLGGGASEEAAEMLVSPPREALAVAAAGPACRFRAEWGDAPDAGFAERATRAMVEGSGA